jgi:cytochrome b pre-mRNA-processing protein 3
MLALLKRLFSPDPIHYRAHQAYVAIVNQARQPEFYQRYQIEDTLDGRFDAILLHLYLVIARCEKESLHPDGPLFVRALSEIFFADMDRSLREMGVGDTGVGKRIRKMVEAFYGRLKAYREASDLHEALRRNAYREKPVPPDVVAALAEYMQRNRQALDAQELEALLQGKISFSH